MDGKGYEVKIAFNILPLKSAHKGRGIGYYTQHLLNALKQDQTLKIQEFTNISEVKDADVIHYPWFDFFFHSLPLKRSSPTVVTIHDVIPLKFSKHYPVGIKGRFNLFLQRLALKSCKVVITDSQASKNDITGYLKIPPQRVEVIYLAADSQFRILPDAKLLYIKRKYKLPDQFMLYVGDANWVKNLPFLIRGFNEILKTKKFDNLTLCLVGEVFLKKVDTIDHPELESLKQVNNLIKQYKLEDKIIKPGKIENEDLVAIFNLATLYIQPSIYEGFGLPILQSFACGLPALSSNRGSLPEVGGNAAVYFDPEDLYQFKTLAQELLRNKSLREKLQKSGFKQVEKFSWARVKEETKQVYKKVTRDK